MARFLEFLQKVFSPWESIMSGIVATIVLGALAWFYRKRWNQLLPWYWYVNVALVVAVCASFFLWDETDTLLQKATKDIEDRRPRLEAGYYNKPYCYGEFPVLMVLVYVKSLGGSPSAAYGFDLMLSDQRKVAPSLFNKGVSVVLALEPLPPLVIPNRDIVPSPSSIWMEVVGDEFIQHRANAAIEPGSMVRGWAMWSLETTGLTCESLGVVSLVFRDIEDREVTVALPGIQRIPPAPPFNDFERFSDITYPFGTHESITRRQRQEGRVPE